MNKKVLAIITVAAIILGIAALVAQHRSNESMRKLRQMVDESIESSQQARDRFDRNIDLLQSNGPNGFGSPAYEARRNRR